jgi:Zn-dependent M28 family amino/carboxypeptidase
MHQQQAMLNEHFTRLGGLVEMQEFAATHPETRQPVQMANLIVRWHPERKQRILLCAHYDTRPFPDQDPVASRRRDPFVGANDGASGVALLAEMAYHMAEFKSKFGIDFVLFDAEEFVFSERDPYFLGSTYFARQYRRHAAEYRYRAAVLFDMIADRDLRIPQDAKSITWPDTRPIVLSIWRTARKLGVSEFVSLVGPDIRDDHVPLHDIGGIPACDIIDFNYGPAGQSYWHTTEDTPDKCSALSLAKVGWVTLTWLNSLD